MPPTLLQHADNMIQRKQFIASQPKQPIFPQEILELIWTQCLIVGTVYCRPRPHGDKRYDDWRSSDQAQAQAQIQVFLVNKASLEFGTHVYFTQNRFVIGRGPDGWPWLTTSGCILGPLAHKFVRNISICFDGRDAFIGDIWGDWLKDSG
jgi:hypothetical protein